MSLKLPKQQRPSTVGQHRALGLVFGTSNVET